MVLAKIPRVINDMFWIYDDKAKNFCSGFATIDNLYIKLDRCDVSEYFDVSEHMRV